MKLSMFSVVDYYPNQGRSVGEFFGQVLDQIELADDLGYNSFFVAEHHFTDYGDFPNPAVALAAAAARTSRIKLGAAVVVLPFRNPIQVAEDYAMLDQISNGRLVMGVGSGYLSHEFDGFGVAGKTKRENFDESLDIIRKLWTGETISYDGEFTKIENTAINVTPVSKDGPGIFVAALRMESVYYVGKNGDNMMIVPYASIDTIEGMAPMMDEYNRGFADSGKDGEGEVIAAFHTYISDTDELAREEAQDAFDLYVETRDYAKSQVYAQIVQSEVCIFGSVETAVDRLVKMHDLGLRHVSMLMNFGGMPNDLVCKSMRLMATEVAPRVQAILAERKGG
ncbi:MAG: LLM class flavin-dependent oxidoreductase [Marinosulfonomonas sp.]|nr:LLM class flavin-dependent oxidoreductase [Marinosulfonomonas sp.]